MLLFDVPSMLVPAIRLGPDRGTALQRSFEIAWQEAAGAGRRQGMAGDFYGRWDAEKPVPALFLNTTSVNLGIPLLISELDLRASSRYSELSNLIAALKKQNDSDLPILQELQKQIGFSQLSFVNTLQFNKNISFPLSFAVTSSARFPYLTPSSLIETGSSAENELFASQKYMQLLDGGMVDNSGLFTASRIRRIMQDVLSLPEFAELKSAVSIELIYFTHQAVALYKPDDGASVPEALAPLVAFDRIRMSRRSGYETLAGQFSEAHEVVLLDSSFQAPLSWSLSSKTKQDIEKRAGGIEDAETPDEDKLCCPGSARTKGVTSAQGLHRGTALGGDTASFWG